MGYSFANLLFIAAFFICLNGFSQSKKWTLQECIDYAMNHNITVKQSEINTEIQEENRKSAVGNFLPNLNASADHNYSFGATIGEDNTRSSSNQQSNNYNISTGITIFNGFQNRNRLKRAKLNKEISEYDLEKTKNDISLEISQAYLQILLNKELIKVAQAQVEISKEQLTQVMKQIESGVVPKGEQYKAESALANDEQELINTQNNLELSQLSLAQFLQIPDYENFDVEEIGADFPSQERLHMSPKQIYTSAERNFPEIKGAELKIESAQKEISIAKARYYPSIIGNYSFGSSWFKVFNMPSEDSYFRTLDLRKFHNGGLTLNIPIFNRMQTKSEVNQAKLNKQIVEYELQDQKNKLNKEIIQAHASARLALKAYNATQKAETSLQNAFDYAKKRYNAGALSIYDFDKAKNDLTQAQSKRLQEKYNFLFRLKVLDFYSGVPLSLN